MRDVIYGKLFPIAGYFLHRSAGIWRICLVSLQRDAAITYLIHFTSSVLSCAGLWCSRRQASRRQSSRRKSGCGRAWGQTKGRCSSPALGAWQPCSWARLTRWRLYTREVEQAWVRLGFMQSAGGSGVVCVVALPLERALIGKAVGLPLHRVQY